MEQEPGHKTLDSLPDLSSPLVRLQYIIGQLSATYGIKKNTIAAAMNREAVFLWRAQKGLSVNPLATDVTNGLHTLGVNMDWYINGGPANLAFIKPPTSVDLSQTALHPSNRQVLGVQTVMLPFVSVGDRMGFAQNYSDQIGKGYQLCPYPNFSGQDLSECYLVEVDADSMEPTFTRGSILVARPMPGDKRFLLPGLYVVTIGAYLVVKRIKENRIGQAGVLELLSDNPLSGPITLQGEMLDNARFFRVLEARVAY